MRQRGCSLLASNMFLFIYIFLHCRRSGFLLGWHGLLTTRRSHETYIITLLAHSGAPWLLVYFLSFAQSVFREGDRACTSMPQYGSNLRAKLVRSEIKSAHTENSRALTIIFSPWKSVVLAFYGRHRSVASRSFLHILPIPFT